MAVTNAGERTLSCNECGASVYRNHLDTGLAGYMAGKLLCVHCFKERRQGGAAAAPPPPPSEPAASPEDPLGTISLEEAIEGTEEPTPARSPGLTGTAMQMPPREDSTQLHRPLNRTGQGATRCRTFHCKLSEEGCRHLDQQINEWVDMNPEVEIKYCTSTVGNWTGKHTEPNLIVNIFY